MGWRDWDQTEWNRRLLEAVFGTAALAPGAVRTVDVTEAFIAGVADESADQGELIQDDFLDLFHVGPSRARALFDVELQLPRGGVPTDSTPSFFGQLYLSCIVASATKETHAEGNFRRRLAKILGLDTHLDYLSRGGLPSLWGALKDWSERASAAGRPIRPLILPDVGNETIIGYSKRLAFPSYSDQTRLARLMVENDLSTDSPVQDILAAVGSQRTSFSDRFREEARRFRIAASSPGRSAIDTPFWAAFESVSWSPSDRTRSRNPRIRLALTLRLPDPIIDCLVAGASAGPSQRGWRIETLVPEIEGCDCRVVGPDGEAPLAYFLAGGDFGGEIRLGYLKRMVHQGCVPFGSSETHPWVSRGSLPKVGYSWLLLRQDLIEPARQRMSELTSAENGLHWVRLERASDWWLVGPLRGGRLNTELARKAPFAGLDAFKSNFSGTRLQLHGAVQLPDGVLFLKPRLPTVTCASADQLLVDLDGTMTDGLEMLSTEEGMWTFPAHAPTVVPVPGQCTIRALQAGEFVDARVVPTVRTCSLIEDRIALRPGLYGCDTDTGQLGDIEDLLAGPRGEILESSEFLRLRARDIATSAETNAVDRTTWTPPVTKWKPIDTVPESWWDVLETCMALTSLRSRGLSWHELVSIVRSGLSIEETGGAERAAENLIQNGLVQRLLSLNSRGVDFLSGPPVVAANGDEVRIVGLLGRLRLAQLWNWAEVNGRRLEIGSLGDFEALGAVRICPGGPEDADRISRMLAIPRLDAEKPRRMAPPEIVLSAYSQRVRLADKALEVKRWGAVRQDRSIGLSMETRRFEHEPHTYALLKGSSPVWGTQSLPWARLVFHRFVLRKSWSLDGLGTLSLPSAAPSVLGARVLFDEKGVCGSSWRTKGTSRWVYSFVDKGGAMECLGSWVQERDTRAAPYVERWVQAYGHAEGKSRRAEVLAKRYSD